MLRNTRIITAGFFFCRNVFSSCGYDTKVWRNRKISTTYTLRYKRYFYTPSGWVLQLSLFWRNAAIPFLFHGSRRGPGTTKPGKSSTDLCNDLISRFLARIHSYVINRTRSKTIKDRNTVGFAGVPTERLLDKYDETFSWYLYVKIEKKDWNELERIWTV